MMGEKEAAGEFGLEPDASRVDMKMVQPRRAQDALELFAAKVIPAFR